MYPPIVIGTFGNTKYTDLLKVVKTGVSIGVSAFDTAPSYGTEKMLGNALQYCMKMYNLNREDLFISDKIDAWQMQESNGAVKHYIEKAVEEMGIQYIDVLFIHWPIEDYLPQTWECLNKLKRIGLVKEIGICNVRKRHLKKWKLIGIEPQLIQIERHPLRTCDEDLQYCKVNMIKVFSYSPLCRMDPQIQSSPILQSLSEKYRKTIGQIVLRWHIDSGTIPIFMSRNPVRIKENVDLFDFSLTQDEIVSIGSLNKNHKIFLESWGCPGF